MSAIGDAVGRPDDRRWYVVRCHAGQEARAERHLVNQSFVTFLPRIERSVRHARRIGVVHAALFPGYLFVRLDLERQRWRHINATYGAKGLVMQGERPAAVPPGIVESIMALTRPGGLVDFTPALVPGAAVRIVAGPLAGTIAELAACDARGRVDLLLDIMGQEVRVRSRASALVPA